MKVVTISEGFTMYVGDVIEALRAMPDQSVQMCVTSPPYWALRDYGVEGQLGLETTPEEYVENMVTVFREVRRVLRNDGTLWLNAGDTYAANRSYQVEDNKHVNVGNHMGSRVPSGFKPKDLIGIPWMLAFALRTDGWFLRSDIIWEKPNPMPSSVRDRPTTNHEYIFLLSKSGRYFYDKTAIAEPAEWKRWGDQTVPKHEGTSTAVGWIKSRTKAEILQKIGKRNPVPDGVTVATGRGNQAEGTIPFDGRTRNKRTVWTFPTQSYRGSHYAVFPEQLAETCILAGTSAVGCCSECGAPFVRVVEKKFYGDIRSTDRSDDLTHGAKNSTGQKQWDSYVPPMTVGWKTNCDHDASTARSVVLDPFIGSGTTAQVARSLGRHCVGIDLDERNLAQAIERYNTPTRAEKKANKTTRARKPQVAQLSLDTE